jgi:hypothetical protein
MSDEWKLSTNKVPKEPSANQRAKDGEWFARHMIKNLTVCYVPWRDGGVLVLRDMHDNMLVCTDELLTLFADKDNILNGLSVGDQRVLHVFRPILEQKPKPLTAGDGFISTTVLDCYLVEHAQLIAGEDRSSMAEMDTYPALERFLSQDFNLKEGEHFLAWFTKVEPVEAP